MAVDLRLSEESHNRTVLSSLEEGDIVEFPRGIYSHYGVYVGNEEIVHLSGEGENDGLDNVTTEHLFTICGESFSKAYIKKDNFWKVAAKSKAAIKNKDNKISPLPKHEIVANALSKMGYVGYNIMYKNCEHFAHWCRYEVEKSEQVETVLTGLALGVAGILTVVATAFFMGDKEKEKEKTRKA